MFKFTFVRCYNLKQHIRRIWYIDRNNAKDSKIWSIFSQSSKIYRLPRYGVGPRSNTYLHIKCNLRIEFPFSRSQLYFKAEMWRFKVEFCDFSIFERKSDNKWLSCRKIRVNSHIHRYLIAEKWRF